MGHHGCSDTTASLLDSILSPANPVADLVDRLAGTYPSTESKPTLGWTVLLLEDLVRLIAGQLRHVERVDQRHPTSSVGTVISSSIMTSV